MIFIFITAIPIWSSNGNFHCRLAARALFHSQWTVCQLLTEELLRSLSDDGGDDDGYDGADGDNDDHDAVDKDDDGDEGADGDKDGHHAGDKDDDGDAEDISEDFHE